MQNKEYIQSINVSDVTVATSLALTDHNRNLDTIFFNMLVNILSKKTISYLSIPLCEATHCHHVSGVVAN